jgi:hypothetical protein
VFESNESVSMRNRGVERGDIHDEEEISVRGSEGKALLGGKAESMVSVLNVGRKATNNRLQDTVKEVRNVFSRARAGRNNRGTRIVRFVRPSALPMIVNNELQTCFRCLYSKSI